MKILASAPRNKPDSPAVVCRSCGPRSDRRNPQRVSLKLSFNLVQVMLAPALPSTGRE